MRRDLPLVVIPSTEIPLEYRNKTSEEAQDHQRERDTMKKSKRLQHGSTCACPQAKPVSLRLLNILPQNSSGFRRVYKSMGRGWCWNVYAVL